MQKGHLFEIGHDQIFIYILIVLCSLHVAYPIQDKGYTIFNEKYKTGSKFQTTLSLIVQMH